MKNLKYFINLLSLFCFFTSNAAFALNRDYLSEEYCHQHHKPYSYRSKLIEKYLPRIPCSPVSCCHVQCPECQDVKIEYMQDKNNKTNMYWTCQCKDYWLKEDFDQYWNTGYDYWEWCQNHVIYDGYLSDDYTKYSSFLFEYLQYTNENINCSCFWPEVSHKAAVINDVAYHLFKELYETTHFKTLIDNPDQQKEFLISSPQYGFNLHGLVVTCVCQSFFYSDYDWICRDLDFYSSTHFPEKFAAEIRDKLNEIREKLALLYLEIYNECVHKHPHQFIKNELYLIHSFLNLPIDLENNDLESLDERQFRADLHPNLTLDVKSENRELVNRTKKIHTNIPYSYRNKVKEISKFESRLNTQDSVTNSVARPKNWQLSDVYLTHGVTYNDLNLYKEAIKNLNQAIQLNPYNRDAYIERALAYFETDQLPSALKDYESAKKLTVVPPFKLEDRQAIFGSAIYVPENRTEFSKGLVSGTLEGAKDSVKEFVPSLLSCCRGILNGLWAFVCSPIEVSQEMINTAYEIGEFINHHNTEECLQCVVPELRELSNSWKKLNDRSKGEGIGFIIGKYGVDIFAPLGVVKGAKGINSVRALKRANTMCTLESCAASPAKQAIIVEESIKRAALREALVIEATNNGKILIKNSNVQYHVMQKKHAWDKVIQLSGNVEEDFQKVITLLEKNNVTDQKNLVKIVKHKNPSINITFSEYKLTINEFDLRIFFDNHLETGESFLKNAWVSIK